jgi:outer membrane protein assembly factor BamA
VKLQISALLIFLVTTTASGQYHLYIKPVDSDTAYLKSKLAVQTEFISRIDCQEYIAALPGLLRTRGYVTASVDQFSLDSNFGDLTLFLGQLYAWAELDTRFVEPAILDAVGWRQKQFAGKPIDFSQLQTWQEKILDHMEKTGYPFAKVFLDSLQLEGNKVSAILKLEKGPPYKIDSLRIYGNAKISSSFLQRYLDIKDGSLYNKEKLARVSSKINELGYVEEEKPPTLSRLGTGSVLNLYLKQKQSSLVNVLVGLLPNNDQLSSKKLLLTGEANLLFRNALGAGETIGLNWQQLQVKSPRLHLIYQHPYLFRSPLGLDLAFDMFRKDSTYLNVNLQVGTHYIQNNQQAWRLFLQRFQTIVNGINQNKVLQTRRLPDEADLSATNAGIDYEFNNTNYRRNPVNGNELHLVASAGTKKLKKNNEVLTLKDPGDPNFDFNSLYDTVKLKTWQFRLLASLARYFPLGKQRSTIKLGLNGGFIESGNLFRNELFQIGGYRLLRGFDEESQFLSRFAIGTIEYRVIAPPNSYFYVLLDGGWGRNRSQNSNINYTYLGTGAGLAFETRAGIFNLAWAIGKRNDSEFNLRQSKVHLGFINYF